MRRTILAAALLLGLIGYQATAQTRTEETVETTDSTGKITTTKVVRIGSNEDITPRSNMIVLNPLKFFLFYNLSYYHRVSNTLVVGGGLQIPTLNDLGGIGVNAELRLHPSGKALRGFYIAPNVAYNFLTSDGSDESVSTFSVGGLVGWQWFPGDEFAIGLGIGADYYFLSTSIDDEVTTYDSYEGTVPALRFDIGYAW